MSPITSNFKILKVNIKFAFGQHGNDHISANIRLQRKLRYRHNSQKNALEGSVIKNGD